LTTSIPINSHVVKLSTKFHLNRIDTWSKRPLSYL